MILKGGNSEGNERYKRRARAKRQYGYGFAQGAGAGIHDGGSSGRRRVSARAGASDDRQACAAAVRMVSGGGLHAHARYFQVCASVAASCGDLAADQYDGAQQFVGQAEHPVPAVSGTTSAVN